MKSKKLYSIVLCLILVVSSALPVFASSPDYSSFLRTTQRFYFTTRQGGSSPITQFTGTADMLGYLGGSMTEFLYSIYSNLPSSTWYTNLSSYVDNLEVYVDGVESTLTNIYNRLPASTWFTNISSYLDGLEGYVDGLEGSLTSINNKLPASTWFTNISNYLDGLEAYVDGLESYVDGLENSLSQVNTKLTNLNSSIDNQGIINSLDDLYTLLDGDLDSLKTYQNGIFTYLDNNLKPSVDSISTNLVTVQNLLGYWNGSRSVSASESVYNSSQSLNSLVPISQSISEQLVTNGGIELNTYNTVLSLSNWLKDVVYKPISYVSRSVLGGTFINSLISSDGYTITYPVNNVNGSVSLQSLSGLGSNIQYLPLFHTDLLNLSQRLQTLGTVYNFGYKKIDQSLDNSVSLSLMDSITYGFRFLTDYLSRLAFVNADDDIISRKLDNAFVNSTALDQFTGSGSSSASGSDFIDLSDSVGAVKNGFKTNVSPSSVLGVFDNSNGYSFWSDQTRTELNNSGGNRAMLRSRSDSTATPLYDQRLDYLLQLIGGDRDD